MWQVDARKVITVSMALAALTALVSVSAVAPTTTVIRDSVDGALVDGTASNPLGFLFAAAMLVAAVCAVTALVLYRRGARRASGRLMVVAGVFGLPAIVPGLVAFVSRYLVYRDRP